jgi:hypothetical protein
MRGRAREMRATGRRAGMPCAVVAGLLLAGGVVPAGAAQTTPACLAKKLTGWGNLRRCQAIESSKALLGQPANPGRCQGTLNTKLTRLNALATAAAIACRYRDNGDRTVTDFDTGLMWEQKDSLDDQWDPANPHDADNAYTWTSSGSFADGTVFTDFLVRINGSVGGQGINPFGSCQSDDAVSVTGGFADHCDWRLPSIAELQSIMDVTRADCGGGGACIDPIFGQTIAGYYWSATTLTGYPMSAWSTEHLRRHLGLREQDLRLPRSGGAVGLLAEPQGRQTEGIGPPFPGSTRGTRARTMVRSVMSCPIVVPSHPARRPTNRRTFRAFTCSAC